MEEIFLPVPDNPKYVINCIGVVKRLAYTVDQINRWGNIVTRKKEERIIKPRISNKGYMRLALCNPNRIDYSVHRLVMKTFKPENELPQINHKDGNKLNNHIDNLEWCTSQHNVQHSFDMGLNKSASGFDDTQNKPVKLFFTGKLIWVFGSIGEASRLTKIKKETISKNCKSDRILSGCSNIGKGCKFQYYE